MVDHFVPSQGQTPPPCAANPSMDTNPQWPNPNPNLASDQSKADYKNASPSNNDFIKDPSHNTNATPTKKKKNELLINKFITLDLNEQW